MERGGKREGTGEGGGKNEGIGGERIIKRRKEGRNRRRKEGRNRRRKKEGIGGGRKND